LLLKLSHPPSPPYHPEPAEALRGEAKSSLGPYNFNPSRLELYPHPLRPSCSLATSSNSSASSSSQSSPLQFECFGATVVVAVGRRRCRAERSAESALSFSPRITTAGLFGSEVGRACNRVGEARRRRSAGMVGSCIAVSCFFGFLDHTLFGVGRKRKRVGGQSLGKKETRANVFLVGPGVLVEGRREEVHGTPSRVLAS